MSTQAAAGGGMERSMQLRLIHHPADVQGVLLQGCKMKGGRVTKGLVRRHLLTSVTNQHVL